MEKNGGVIFRDSQELSHIFARPLVEHAQRDHGSLNFPKLGHARSQPQLFDGSRHDLVGKWIISVGKVESVYFLVRTGSKVTPPMIARRVAHDGRQNGTGVVRGFELTCSC